LYWLLVEWISNLILSNYFRFSYKKIYRKTRIRESLKVINVSFGECFPLSFQYIFIIFRSFSFTFLFHIDYNCVKIFTLLLIVSIQHVVFMLLKWEKNYLIYRQNFHAKSLNYSSKGKKMILFLQQIAFNCWP
jgi:hypothetical protein